MSKWKEHRNKWKACTACKLSNTRNKVVLYKGKLPCDVLFVGEAPGASENVLGKPFVGPAGKLLDIIIEKAIEAVQDTGPFDTGFTQLVGCVPKNEQGQAVKEIPEEAIKCCSGRLFEIYEIANPSLVVCVGKLAVKWFPQAVRDPLATVTDMLHPAALLMADEARRSLAIQREIVRLSDSLFKVFN